jgi:hypothetical protein
MTNNQKERARERTGTCVVLIGIPTKNRERKPDDPPNCNAHVTVYQTLGDALCKFYIPVPVKNRKGIYDEKSLKSALSTRIRNETGMNFESYQLTIIEE